MTEQERFLARFEAARKDGLVDLKFFVQSDKAHSDEDVFAAANQFEDAVENGLCVRRSAWEGDVKPTLFAPLY